MFSARSLHSSALFISFLFLVGTLSASAAEHFVSSTTTTFDASSLLPGDVITLGSGPRGPLKITNIKGSTASPIIVRNDPSGSGPVVIRRTSPASGGFVLHFGSCENFVLDGGQRPGTTYGIVVTSAADGDGPSSFIHLSGSSSDFTIRHVEVDGKWPSLTVDGVGIQLNDHDYTAAEHPGVWRENIVLESNYVHDVQGEGMYIGPNWRQGGLPLRNIEIRNNRFANTGWEGVQLKNAIQGRNSIHHNSCSRCGSNPDPDGDAGQESAFSLYEGMGDIYNNWVKGSGERGIQHYIHYMPSSYGVMPSRIYNNVIIGAGTIGQANDLRGFGIYAGSNEGDYATVQPTIYNNTIIDSEGGIQVNSSTRSGSIRDNIIAGASSAATEIQKPSVVTSTNNVSGAVNSMGFVDPSSDNFRLTASSPNKDKGGSSGFPAVDHDGTSRPQFGAADRGAFEHASDDPQPGPPVLSVQ